MGKRSFSRASEGGGASGESWGWCEAPVGEAAATSCRGNRREEWHGGSHGEAGSGDTGGSAQRSGTAAASHAAELNELAAVATIDNPLLPFIYFGGLFGVLGGTIH